MKYPLAVLLIFCASVASAATFTAVQSGDWSAPSTWGLSGSATCHTTVPCMTDASNAGDTVLIPDKYTVTCGATGDETCSVGTSPASASTNVLAFSSSTGGGGLHVCGKTPTAGCTGGTNGSVLIYAGSIGWSASGSSQGTFIFDPGSTLQYDSSWAGTPGSVAYVISTKSTAGATSDAIWAINGTSSNHVTFQGDSFYSSRRKSSACTSPGSCLGGVVGYNGGSYNESGCGTVTYLDMSNFQGGWNSNIYQLCSTSISYSTFTNTGAMTAAAVPSGNKNWSLAYASFSNCRTNCLSFTGNATNTGSFSIKNAVFDSYVAYGAITQPNFAVQNILITSGSNNGQLGQYPGFQNVASGTADQIFIYNNAVITGTLRNLYSLLPVQAVTNSVFWREMNNEPSTTGSIHPGGFTHYLAATPSITNKVLYNVYGAAGSCLNSGDDCFFSGNWTNPPASGTYNYLFAQNVLLCDAYGHGSFSSVHASGTSHILITVENNTNCASAYNLTNPGPNDLESGSISTEASPSTPTFSTIDSNLFHQVSGGYAIAEISAAAALTGAATNISNNAVYNTNTSATPICSYCAGWAVTGPVNDLAVLNREAVTVEPNRSVPLFDLEYLAPAGLFGAAYTIPGGSCSTLAQCLTNYYAATEPNWQGMWSTGAGNNIHGDGKFHAGDVTCDSQFGIYGGSTTCWRCIQQNVPSSTNPSPTGNRPLSGFDSSNVYYGYAAYWELAYLAFARASVAAGTIYSDGALPSLVDTSANPLTTYFVGLLNAWLRHGMTSMEPSLWNGCLNGKECGARSLANIQHIPPPAAVN